jgi:hypothetical protein
MHDFLLYTESVVALLVLLLMAVQLFDDVSLSAPVITTLMSLVVTTVSIDLM